MSGVADSFSADDLDAVNAIEGGEVSLEDELAATLDRIEAGQHESAASEEPTSEPSEQPGEEPAEPTTPAEPQEPRGDERPESTATAPEHWSQADKDFLKGLPDDATRTAVMDWRKQIEKAADEKFQEAGNIRREVEGVNQALAPIEATLQQHGVTKGDAVGRLVGAHLDLVQDLGTGLAKIAGQYVRSGVVGTDQARQVVRQVAQALGVEGGPPAAGDQANTTTQDPAAIAEAAARRVVEQHQREANQRYDQEVRSSAQAKLTAFIEAKDDQGQSKHPHYQAVRPVMQGLIAAAAQDNRPMTLEEAYEQAVWTRPELREATIKAQQEEAAKAADEARRSKVAKARNAGTPKTTSAPTRTVEPPEPEKSTEQLLEDGWDRLMGPTQ